MLDTDFIHRAPCYSVLCHLWFCRLLFVFKNSQAEPPLLTICQGPEADYTGTHLCTWITVFIWSLDCWLANWLQLWHI